MKKINLAVIGLGYVGLPLASAFSKNRKVIGFDISKNRIDELLKGVDSTNELEKSDFLNNNLSFTTKIDELKNCNFFIITVPTPVDEHNQPDFNPLKTASLSVGKILKNNDIVVYESTVYPGATENICVKFLEKSSSLKFNKDFFVGYSPERINPGDKINNISNIVKVVSGSNKKVSNTINKLYKEVALAGTYLAPSIKVAEAAKIIENIQRDVNIALINELSMIFSKLNIDTSQVIDAASSKWNFIKFKPGLVGGHCIGVDPYYLTHIAQHIGYHPEIILSSRRINNQMTDFVISKLQKAAAIKKIHLFDSKILMLGITFKENCPDIRNSRVVDLVGKLKSYTPNIYIFDPWVSSNELKNDFNLKIIKNPKINFYDFIIISVAHKEFVSLGPSKIKSFGKKRSLIFDLKSIFEITDSDLRL